LAGQDHILEHTAVLSGALSPQILGVTAGSDVAEALLVLASLAEELLDLGAGIVQQRFYSLGLLLSREHVHSKLVAAVLQHVQLVTRLYFFIVGACEQFPLDEVQMNLLIF
jgi:hypothetical protein